MFKSIIISTPSPLYMLWCTWCTCWQEVSWSHNWWVIYQKFLKPQKLQHFLPLIEKYNTKSIPVLTLKSLSSTNMYKNRAFRLSENNTSSVINNLTYYWHLELIGLLVQCQTFLLLRCRPININDIFFK